MATSFVPAAPLLELVDVRRRRGRGADDFTLEIGCLTVRAGDRLAITGPNGSGKSTCLDLLSLTLAPSAASRFAVALDGGIHDIAAAWRRGDRGELARLRAGHIGYVLQVGGLLPFLDVRENVALPLRLRGALDADGVARVEALLERLGVAALADRRPAALSLGERQKAAVARALVHRPRLVLADEPTASLDQRAAEEVMRLFAELIQENGCATILVTHSQSLATRHGFTPVACLPLPEAGEGRRSRIEHHAAA